MILFFALLGLGVGVYANSQSETQSSESSEQAPAVSESEKPISSMGDRLRSLLGIAAFLGLCFFLSNSRSDINWRTVFWGLGLQFFLGFLILKT
ncbi:MAG: Na+ dependent nucleoside transporter N-terminal domain-containing protein, partial [Planctomycetota bacterium]